MARTKLTGFSRLVIFLLIFLPLAYFGASYYNGEDPVAKLKSLFGQSETSAEDYNNHRPGNDTYNPNAGGSSADGEATFENVGNMRSEIKDLRQRLTVAEEKLARCQADNVE